MTSILLEDKSIENFEKAVLALQKNSSSIIILACDKNNFEQQLLNPILKQATIPIIGGIFPAIVYKNRQYDQGTILLGLNNTLKVTTVHHISKDREYDEIIAEEMGLLNQDVKTMFLFFDGISKNIDSIIQSLFNNFGLTINYIGGAAAGRDFQKKPILFSNEGLLEDAALLATSTSASTIGVKHGWQPIEKATHQITKSDGKLIYELDYKPAFGTYKKIIEAHAGKPLDQEEFFQAAKSYPLGISRLSGDNIVRVVNGVTDEGALFCTGDIVENTSIQILHATNAQLVQAAEQASLLSHNTHYQTSFKLYIGCLARLLVMGENFYKEIDAIYEEDELLIGALSVGEIANNKDHYLEFYNSTAVVAKIADV